MKIVRGIIKPGKQIGDLEIGKSCKEHTDLLIHALEIEKREGGSKKYTFENFKLWFNPDGELDQIGVTNGFLDCYKNIGIGSTMGDVKRLFGGYRCEYDDYLLPDIDGICFALKDIDDSVEEWDELTAPIEWIFVYKI